MKLVHEAQYDALVEVARTAKELLTCGPANIEQWFAMARAVHTLADEEDKEAAFKKRMHDLVNPPKERCHHACTTYQHQGRDTFEICTNPNCNHVLTPEERRLRAFD